MPRPLFRLPAVLAVALGLVLAAAAPHPAEAGSRELKATGKVGETVNGYLGIVDPSATNLAAEVEAINAERRQAYQDAAAGTGRPLAEVEAVAGARLREKAQPGDWIQNAAGEWIQR